MKKRILALICLLVLSMSCGAFAEAEWFCSDCDIEVKGNFCSNCGGRKAETSDNEPSSGEHSLELSVEFVENIFLSTYDVEVHIDGEKYSTMDHGEDFSEVIPLSEGKHTILFCEEGNESVSGFAMVQVSGETYFSCTINAHSDEVEISEVSTNGKVAEQEQQAAMKDAYTASCETVKYSDVERYPDKFNGSKIKVSGKVIQVAEGWFDTVTLRIKDGNGDIWYAEYTRKDGESRILEDDRVTVYGTCSGVETYSTILGESITIPAMKIEYADIK